MTISANDAPPSLRRLGDVILDDAGVGELGAFPPPPDIDELKQLLAADELSAAKMREFGWITG